MLRPLAKRVVSQMSAMSSQRYTSAASPKLVEVTKNDDNGISIISMARGPVNGLNLPLLTDLNEALITAQKNGSRGVILTSSLPKIFSAGLDIMEMYKPNEIRVVKFWTALQDVWMTLYGMDIPTAAAINGSSPAGGCLLAMACEHRVITEGKHTIGLNETQLGIVAPKWFMYNMIDTIGYRQAESALLRGKLFTPQEALKIGLVDEIAVDKEEAIAKCSDYVASFAMIPGRARGITKSNLRNDRIFWLKNNREKDTAIFVGYVKDPKVQVGLDYYVQSLKRDKSKL